MSQLPDDFFIYGHHATSRPRQTNAVDDHYLMLADLIFLAV